MVKLDFGRQADEVTGAGTPKRPSKKRQFATEREAKAHKATLEKQLHAGTLVVPAMGLPHGAMHHAATNGATTQPSEPKPRAIIIIPKGSLKKAPAEGDLKKVVASAR